MSRVVYQSGSPLRQPRVLFTDWLRDLGAARALAWRLFIRNISARYRQSLLGYFWAVFPPFATAGIWLMLTSSKVITIDDVGMSYPVFLITGTILWQSFVDALQIPLRVVGESRQMLAKINFPREALPMTAFLECGFNTVIRLCVLASVLTWFGVSPAHTALLALVGVLGLIILGLVLGMLLAPIALLYDDVQSALVLLLQIWLYCTPVIYAPSNEGWLATLATYNPVSPLLVQTRDWLLTGQDIYVGPLVWVMMLTLLTGFLALLIYRIALPRAIERISA